MQAEPGQVAEQVRAALLTAALTAYEEAGIRGVCAEGAWEVAVGAMRALDLSAFITFEPDPTQLPSPPRPPYGR